MRHLVPAVALTAIVLSIHTLLRPLGRLVDKVPAGKAESVAAYTVLVEVFREHASQLREEMLEALDQPGLTARGVAGRIIDNDADEPEVVHLRIDIEVEGKPDPLLGRVG